MNVWESPRTDSIDKAEVDADTSLMWILLFALFYYAGLIGCIFMSIRHVLIQAGII